MRKLALLLSLSPLAHAEHPPASVPERLWTEGTVRKVPVAPLNTQSFVKLAGTLGPAVVNISTVQGGEPGHPLRGEPAQPRSRGQGTGFVIEKSGYILTNNHVVDNTRQIRVRLADDRDFVAHLVGRDERTDIAVIKIDIAGELPVAPLGDSDNVQIGEWVVAIGNPFGLDHTVTVGIVSAKGRRDVRPGGSTTGFYDFIQTDASINVGNSGGPLINTRGEVIGINTAMNAQAQGIAFAIPINMAKAIVPKLVSLGRAPRAWLGLFPQSVTPTLQRAFGLPDTHGALVSDVVAGSPASLAGIETGDVVLQFDGHPIRRADDLQWWVAIGGAGRKVPLTIAHAGETRHVTVMLAEAPDEESEHPAPEPPHGPPSALGMTVSEITAGIARELQKPSLRGVMVMAVESDSPASDAGVERGDILLRVGDVAIEKIEDYARAVRAVPKGAMIKLLAKRDGKNIWLAFQKR